MTGKLQDLARRLAYLAILAWVSIPSFVSAAPGRPGFEHKDTTVHSATDIQSLGDVPRLLFRALMLFFPAVTTLWLAFAGYRYIIAQGNPDLIEKAKKSLTYAVFGVIVSYSSVVVIIMVADFLNFTTGLRP